MSNCRTFNRSSRREQKPKPQNIGIRALQKMAHGMIETNPQLYLDKLAELFLIKGFVTAGTKLFDLAAEAQLEEPEESGPRRPSLISRWTLEAEQQDKDKQQSEAEAAQEAASREMGQIPEPQAVVAALAEPVAVKAVSAPAPQRQSAAAQSNISNTHVNEIGLPVPGHSQIADVSGTRSCRSTPRPGAPGHESNQAALNQSGKSIYA